MDDAQLALLFAFLNSHDLEGVADWLVPERYPEWVRATAAEGLLDADDDARAALLARLRVLAGDPVDVSPAELDRARDARDVVIALLLADGAPDADDVAIAASLDVLIRDVPLRLHVTSRGAVQIEPATAGPLAIVAAALVTAHDAAIDGTWARIRLCSADDCHWAFVDRSRNSSRRWCSMGDCGARAKARAYRARQRIGDE